MVRTNAVALLKLKEQILYCIYNSEISPLGQSQRCGSIEAEGAGSVGLNCDAPLSARAGGLWGFQQLQSWSVSYYTYLQSHLKKCAESSENTS